MRVKREMPGTASTVGNVIMDVNQTVDFKGIKGIARFINSIVSEKKRYQVKVIISELPEE